METSLLSYAVWCSSETEVKPDVSFVPAMERRRLTAVERAALSVLYKTVESAKTCGIPAEELASIPLVFASRWGEIGTTLKLMTQFHSDHEMSPAGFSSSVHNAAPGAWSLLMKDRASYTAIAAREHSLESGLLEAMTTYGRVLFAYAEEATPEFYRPVFSDVQNARAVAVLLDSNGGGKTATALSVDFRHSDVASITFDAFTAFLSSAEGDLNASDFRIRRLQA